MTRFIVAALGAALLFPAASSAQQPATPPSGAAAKPPAPPKLDKADEMKTVYAIGLLVGSNVKSLDLNASELERLKKGLTDAVLGKKPEVSLDEYKPKVQMFAQSRQERVGKREQAKADDYLAKMAKEPGATKTASGLIYRTLQPGDGPGPTSPTDKVKVNYEGKLTDGKVFDSSTKQGGKPIEFPLNQVIPCWTEGVQKMKLHEKARLICPPAIGYGPRGSPPTIPPNAALVFEVELLQVTAGAPPAAAPGAPGQQISLPPPAGKK